MKRIIPGLLVLALCICCLVSPVLAADDALSMINLLDYGFCSENGTNSQGFSGNSTVEFTYSFPSNTVVHYVDIVFIYSATADIPTVNLFLNGSNRGDLNVVRVNGNVFRAYGSFGFYNGRTAKLVFDAGANSSNRITIESLKFGRDSYSHNDINCVASVMSSNFEGTINFVPGGDNNFVSFVGSSSFPYSEIGMQVFVEDWKSYDYLDLYFYCSVGSINSVACLFDGVDVPFTMAYMNSANAINNSYVFNVCIDVSDLDRTLDSYPLLVINGQVIQSEQNFLSIMSCVGSVYLAATDPETFWYNRLWNSIVDGFDSLATSISNEFSAVQIRLFALEDQLISHKNSVSSYFDQLLEALGYHRIDESLSESQQTQEEINVSINNQLIGAVEDWNTNIEIVETGYDSALTKTTPALSWLASLADRIFTNMGWFGNIYFLLGLISVIMLVLSKSGLAVSRIRRID